MIRPLPSKLVKHQTKKLGPFNIPESEGFGEGRVLTIEVRWDDSCGNGHNSFAVTGTIERKVKGRNDDCDACGCLHNEIAKYGPPDVSKLIKWHFMGADGPMHYKENTEFWLSKWKTGGDHTNYSNYSAEECLKFARESACLRDGEEFPDHDLPGTWRYLVGKFLDDRLQGMMLEFRKDIEEFGFTY